MCKAAVVPFAQAQIEREADDRAVRIIGCEDVAIDRIDRGCGIDEGRAQAHLLRRALGPAGRLDDVLERASKRLEIIVEEIGRESCRERVCQYVEISGAAVSLKKKKKHNKEDMNI